MDFAPRSLKIWQIVKYFAAHNFHSAGTVNSVDELRLPVAAVSVPLTYPHILLTFVHSTVLS